MRSPRDASLRSTCGPACSVVTDTQHRPYGCQFVRGSIANPESRGEAGLELTQIYHHFDPVPFLPFMTVAHSSVTNTSKVTSVTQASNHCVQIASSRQDFHSISSLRLGFHFRSRLCFTSHPLVSQSSLEGLDSDTTGFAST